MPNTDHDQITLGHFYKIICDTLGLWKSNDSEVDLEISANEKVKSKILKASIKSLEKKQDSFSLKELLEETTKNSPSNQKLSRKLKSIQKIVNEKAKNDFSSIHEVVELNEQIVQLIDECFDEQILADLSKDLLSLSVMYFSEFFREHISTCLSQAKSQQYFKENILISLLNQLVEKNLNSKKPFFQIKSDDKWPLKSLVNQLLKISGVSLYQLHQFHEIRFEPSNNGCTDNEVWQQDFTSKPINTKSKQLIERLSKNNKIKWESFYKTILPLANKVVPSVSREEFSIVALSTFFAHNLNLEYLKFNQSIENYSSLNYPIINEHQSLRPTSIEIDNLFNYNEHLPEDSFDDRYTKLMNQYENLTNVIQLFPSSPEIKIPIPNTIQFIYDDGMEYFPIEVLYHKYGVKTDWLEEWIHAKIAAANGNSFKAFHHFKKAFEASKYRAGSLFILLYIEICAFTKQQYKNMKSKGEEHIFEEVYEPLGSDVARYAQLLGYSSYTQRDPRTLFTEFLYPLKSKRLLNKIDALTEKHLGV